MRAPSNITLICLAVVLFFLAPMFMSDYYPAAHPVVGPDGSVLHGADGKILYHRDMTRYYQMMIPTYILLSLSAVCVIWLLVRLVRYLYGRVRKDRHVA
jgi:hypothetical protein